ncbi:MAG TPA: T9SS type A sorting domain-containing protein, partial [Candidatus Kapabacteria bacterium]|nr:T9SS type A sorting domain-containing protein [Candidatus Kapabacteria bacterium]
GGKSWKCKELPDKKNVYGACTTSDKKIWITGTYRRNDTGMSYIYIDYSTDNGDTWKNSLDTIFPGRSPNSSEPRKIQFYDSLNGAMVGSNGTFVRTTDGGKTWHDEVRKGVKPDTMVYGSFYDFDYKTQNTIALYGQCALRRPRLIFAPLLSIPSGLKNDEISKSNNYISPNPATDFITINYDYEGNGASSPALIYDILGVKVAQEPLINGSNKINISQLTSGVYFVKIGDRVEKFVKI